MVGFLDLQKPLTRQVGSLWSCELCPCSVSELAIQAVALCRVFDKAIWHSIGPM